MIGIIYEKWNQNLEVIEVFKYFEINYNYDYPITI